MTSAFLILSYFELLISFVLFLIDLVKYRLIFVYLFSSRGFVGFLTVPSSDVEGKCAVNNAT